MQLGLLLGGALVSAVEVAATRELALRSPFVLAALVFLILLVTVSPKLTTRAITEAREAAES
jgi:hypothetical protein